nr:hypothetical protein Iba_chr10aCG15490 [Ipomoea batatas]
MSRYNPVQFMNFLTSSYKTRTAAAPVLLKIFDRALRLHHHPPPNCVQGIRQQPGRCRDPLSHQPALPQSHVWFRFLGHHVFYGIKTAKVEASVNDHPLKRSGESPVYPSNSFFLVDSSQEMADAPELASIGSPEVRSKPCMRNIERVDDYQRCTSSSSPRNEISRWTGQEVAFLKVAV